MILTDELKTGVGIGAAVGAVVGQVVGDDTEGTLIGAAVGALGGGAVGHYMDKQTGRIRRGTGQRATSKRYRNRAFEG